MEWIAWCVGSVSLFVLTGIAWSFIQYRRVHHRIAETYAEVGMTPEREKEIMVWFVRGSDLG